MGLAQSEDERDLAPKIKELFIADIIKQQLVICQT